MQNRHYGGLSVINMIYTNGCSWTAGSGTTEDPEFKIGTDIKQYAWPTYLAEMMGCSLLNESIGAGSNDRLVRMTCDYLRSIPASEYNTLLVVIGWTNKDRQEIFINDEWRPCNPAQQFSTHQMLLNPLSTDVAAEIDKYQKQYVTYVHSDYADTTKYVNQKYLLANLLENIGVKYIFTDSLPAGWVEDRNLHAGLCQIARPPIINEPSFLTFCKINGMAMSSCLHPMIDAHRAWAYYILNVVQDLYPDLRIPESDSEH